jgi:hypothetical protein
MYRARRPVHVKSMPELPSSGKPAPEPERDFQAWLRAEAQAAGAKYFHDYMSRRNPQGFPDTVIVTPGGLLLFAELKRESDSPTEKQAEWLDALGRVQRLHSGWFRPSMRPDLERLIRS